MTTDLNRLGMRRTTNRFAGRVLATLTIRRRSDDVSTHNIRSRAVDLTVGGVAQLLGRQSFAGGLSGHAPDLWLTGETFRGGSVD